MQCLQSAGADVSSLMYPGLDAQPNPTNWKLCGELMPKGPVTCQGQHRRHTRASSEVLRSFFPELPSPLAWRLCWRGPSAAMTAFSRCAMLSMMPLPRVVTYTSARTCTVLSCSNLRSREVEVGRRPVEEDATYAQIVSQNERSRGLLRLPPVLLHALIQRACCCERAVDS